MINIILAILCSTGVSQILKIDENKNLSTRSIFLLNYIVAAAAAAFQADFSTLPSHEEKGILFIFIAIILGFLFIGSFYIYKKAIGEMGVSLAATVSRLSTGLPILGSILFFREVPTLTQALGVGLIFIAIPLASDKTKEGTKKEWSPWGLLLFLAFGINDFLLKIVKELWPGVSDGAFLFFVFLTSALTALTLVIIKNEKPKPSIFLPGLLLGLVNLGSSFFLMKSLFSLSAIIVYPLFSMGIILLGLLTGVFFWKEKMTLPHILFLIIAVGAIILIS